MIPLQYTPEKMGQGHKKRGVRWLGLSEGL
jgi:hypothetical protein